MGFHRINKQISAYALKREKRNGLMVSIQK